MREIFLEKMHPFMIKALASIRRYTIEIDGRIPDFPCIFAVNHYGMNDVPTALEVIGRHVYILADDGVRGSAAGLAMSANGVIWFNRAEKEERKRSYSETIQHLKAGHSILVYPESTWNMTPNLLMLPMHWGVVRFSRETGVPIVPIFQLFSEKTCYVKIGGVFSPSEDVAQAIQDLRDIMATLFWNLAEEQPVFHRETFKEDYWINNIAKRLEKEKNPEWRIVFEKQFIFKPKNQIEHADAFAHLEQLRPQKQNMFLFNKKWKG